MTSTTNPCPRCKGSGIEPGTEVWGKETDRCGSYTMEIMEADDCEECDGDGINPDEKIKCNHCGHAHTDDDEDHCPECGEGRTFETLYRTAVHVARKDHGSRIRSGDTYRRTVSGGYTVDGPRWMTVSKTLVRRGSAQSKAI